MTAPIRRHTFATLALCLVVALACSEAGAPPEAGYSGKGQSEAGHPLAGLASSSPPGGLAVHQVPQFVHFGFDDNAISGRPGSGTDGGMRFVTELFAGKRNPAGIGNRRTYDGASAAFSFYVVTRHIEEPGPEEHRLDAPENVKRQWRAAVDAGHEIGLHTHTHPHGSEFTSEEWLEEIEACRSWLLMPFDGDRAAESDVGIGVDAAALTGFRAPYLEHGEAMFPALRQAGLAYDCSIQEGFQDTYDGTNLPWPYRLESGDAEDSLELWEIPAYIMIVPPDSECERYGAQPGLRARLADRHDYFDPDTGKITGFDWNLWVEFGMTRSEVVATVTYSLDLRLSGNRAPLTFGAHSDIYSNQYPGEGLNATAAERRQALEEIVEYALTKPETRIVSARQILDWVRDPVEM